VHRASRASGAVRAPRRRVNTAARRPAQSIVSARAMKRGDDDESDPSSRHDAVVLPSRRAGRPRAPRRRPHHGDPKALPRRHRVHRVQQLQLLPRPRGQGRSSSPRAARASPTSARAPAPRRSPARPSSSSGSGTPAATRLRRSNPPGRRTTPYTFKLGAGQAIPAFEEAVADMKSRRHPTHRDPGRTGGEAGVLAGSEPTVQRRADTVDAGRQADPGLRAGPTGP
jgi:hypothetical protein